MIVLGAEEEIDEEDRDGGASDNHDAVAEEQEAEHVVHFAKPHVVHDEVEFDEDGAEGEDTDESHGGQRAQVGGARWDLTRNLVNANGRLHRLGDNCQYCCLLVRI